MIILDAPDEAPQILITTPIEKQVSTIETVLIILRIIGAVFKIQSWPYSSLLLIVSLVGGAVLSIFAATALFQGNNTTQKSIAYFAGLTLSLGYLGAFFTIESWAYGTEMKFFSFLFSFFILVWAIIIFIKSEKNKQNSRFIVNVLVRIIGLGLINLLTGTIALMVYKMLKAQLFKTKSQD